jgi:gliding motility-associated-like protein
MRHFFTTTYLLLAALLPLAVAQTDGWTSTCSPTTPSVSEVMIDACGDEFQSEYVILKTKSIAFDIRNFGFEVTNPFNAVFVGSVAVTNNSVNDDALKLLNEAAGAACGYGTVFRNAFSASYNGIIPPNSTVLLFNNRDSTDVTYLSPNVLNRLCGSKVFVVFGTLTPQSRGASVFRNYPQNGSCGTTGCLRQIDFKFNGQTCTQFTYDIKKLPHLNSSNPPVGFNEGSYISPNQDGTMNYGGGNLTGNALICMPTTRLECTIPPMPDFGNGYWNVLAFDGQNTYTAANFKGFYTANDHDPTTIPADTIDGSFSFNTRYDGWQPKSAPSEALAIDGARTTYDGCNVRADSFSIQAKRQGFPCGFYKLSWQNYDDNARIRLDANGDGTFEFDQTYNAPSCSSGCGTSIWQGDLGSKSRMEIYGSEQRGTFNLHLIFQKDTVGHPSVKINVLSTTPTPCGATPAVGAISTAITGGFPPYILSWRGATTIPNGTFMPTGLPAGIFHATATDAYGCVDSAQILVPQTNSISVQAMGDATFCPNSTATLRGVVLGANPPLTVTWTTATSETVLSTDLNFSPIVPKTTTYILRATDARGCFKTDSVDIKTHFVRKVRVTFTPKDTICNDDVAIFTARGSSTYTWTSFPQIGMSALNTQNEKATLFALFLPAPNYFFYAAGKDANGCRDTGSARIWINPLPVVTITPVMDTLCDDGAPYKLVGTPAGGLFFSRTCGTCVENGFFYPNRAGIGAHEVQHRYSDVNGCDNEPSILINVKNCRCLTSVSIPRNKDICLGDSFRIKNVYYKTSGIYRDSFKKVDGCDSILIWTLNVRVGDSTVRKTVKVCPPSVLGIDTAIVTAANGCKSLVITTKIAARTDSFPILRERCQGDSVQIAGRWIKTAGTTRIRFTNTEGCDSTYIVNLILRAPDTIRQQVPTCNRVSVSTDTMRLRNRFGCDSMVITERKFSLVDTIVQPIKTTCNLELVGFDTLRLSNSLGCDSVLKVTQMVYAPSTMKINLTISKSISCNGNNDGSVKILSVQNAPSRYQILWSNGGKGDQIDNVKVGTYTVVVTDTAGCSVKDSIRLTEPLPIRLVATGIAPPCFTDNRGAIRLDSIINGTAPFTLIFQNNRSPIASLPRRLDSVRLGFQTLQVVDSKGCRAQTSAEVPEAPDRSIELGSDRRIILGDSTLLSGFLNFTPKSQQWTWTPKDSSIRCSTCLTTIAKPTETTIYRLVARDSVGCEVIDQIVIQVDKPRNVFIPTTFSPNNDLVNDNFTIFGDISVKRVQSFRIFNRWGDPVFERVDFPLNDESMGWNGSVKGTAMPPDVYVFVAVVEFVDKKVLIFKGNVTLMR